METVISKTDFRLAKHYIESGDAVAFHTETVYGLGANAFSDDAIKRIFELKGRPSDNPLIVHVHSEYDIAPLIDSAPPYAAALRKAFLPGPLTMIYPSTGKVSRFVSCGLNTLAIRIPSSPTAQMFLKEVNMPIAAPSANISKHVSPVTARHVFEDFNGRIPLILDGGDCQGGIESTVLDCTGEIPQILREGLVTREMIASVTGACGIYHMTEGEKPKSPGMAYKHYSPRCKTMYCYSIEEALELYQEDACILCESAVAEKLQDFRTLDLGGTGEEMARRLYSLLRKGEKTASLLIGIEPKRKDDVMAGVLNRLHRAFGV